MLAHFIIDAAINYPTGRKPFDVIFKERRMRSGTPREI
jgi:hypothetical protein